jgi:Mg/Co/Ni transporter MgtE
MQADVIFQDLCHQAVDATPNRPRSIQVSAHSSPPATAVLHQVNLPAQTVDPNQVEHPERRKKEPSEIHPEDVADIVEKLNSGQRVTLLEGLDTEHASDTLEEIDRRCNATSYSLPANNG